MSRTKKIWLIAASFLALIGLILFASVMTAYRWDFSRLGTEKYVTKTYEINESFSRIKINADNADILLGPSDDGSCQVICYEPENIRYSADVREDTLFIDAAYDGKWYEHIGINLDSPRVTVFLPQAQYDLLSVKGGTGDIEIPREPVFANAEIISSTGDIRFFATASEIYLATTTGDISVANLSAEKLDLSVSTGEITVSNTVCEGDITIGVSTGGVTLNDIQCKNILSSGNTGDISLYHVIAAEKISLERSTGDVRLNGADAAWIYVKTSTGDVTGVLFSEKIFITETSSGSVTVPKSSTGGKCEIITSTGNIAITIDEP